MPDSGWESSSTRSCTHGPKGEVKISVYAGENSSCLDLKTFNTRDELELR